MSSQYVSRRAGIEEVMRLEKERRIARATKAVLDGEVSIVDAARAFGIPARLVNVAVRAARPMRTRSNDLRVEVPGRKGIDDWTWR